MSRAEEIRSARGPRDCYSVFSARGANTIVSRAAMGVEGSAVCSGLERSVMCAAAAARAHT